MIILAILLLFNIAVLVWLATKRAAPPTLLVCLTIYFTSWMLLPILLTLGMGDRVSRVLPMDRGVYVRYAQIEVACFLAVLLLFGLIRKPDRFIERSLVAQWMPSRRVEGFLVLAAACCDLIARQTLIGGTYEDNNALAMRVAPIVLARAGIILLVDSIACGFLYATIVRGARSRTVTAVAWVWIFVATAQWLVTGQRTVLLMPSVLLLLWVHESSVSRKALALGHLAVAVFAATIGLGGMLVIGELRGSKRVELSTAAKTTVSLARRPLGQLVSQVLQQLQIKFDSIGAGVALVEKEGRGRAGLRPYEGAVLALVPRSIFPQKPIPGSADGTFAGTPSRAAAAALGYDPRFVNVGVSASAIELWHFGLAGLLVLVILNVLHLALVSSLLWCPGVVPRTLAMVLIGLPLAVPLYGSGDVIVMNAVRILALYALAALALLVASRWTGPIGNEPPPRQTHPHPDAQEAP